MDRRWLLLAILGLTGCAGRNALPPLMGGNPGDPTKQSTATSLLGAKASRSIEPRSRPLNFDLIPELHQ